MTSSTVNRPSDWFIRNMEVVGRSTDLVDEGHLRCLDTLGAITEPSGLYNLPTPIGVVDSVEFFPGGISLLTTGDYSTHDFDRLTRLVLRAHENYVRVSFSPWLHHMDESRAKLVADFKTNEYGYMDPLHWSDPQVAVGIMEIMLHVKHPPGDGKHRWETHPGLEELHYRLSAGSRDA